MKKKFELKKKFKAEKNSELNSIKVNLKTLTWVIDFNCM